MTEAAMNSIVKRNARRHAAQQEVIEVLCATGNFDLAGRLERCMTARRGRHSDGGGRKLADRSHVLGVANR